MQMGEPGRSMLYRQKLYELDPENPVRLTEMCGGLWQLWDFEGARECSEGYLERFPEDLEARKQYAAAQGDYVEAIRLAEEHVELEPWSEYRKVQHAFETAVDNKWSFYSASLVGYGDPHLDSIADEPRYQALVERLRERMAAERAWFEANRDLPLD